MRKIFTLLSLFMVSLALFAVPAKPRLWKTIKLTDGTEVHAQLKGDEFGHYWQGSNGLQYVAADGRYVLRTLAMENRAKERRMAAQLRRLKRAAANREAMSRRAGSNSSYTGEKKGLIILVNFKDVKFQNGHDQALYDKIANQQGYTSSEGFVGSVSDYFHDQSLGQFELTFDIVGPVTVSKNMKEYGANDANGDDKDPGELVVEAIKLVKSSISDWSKYDWDGDNYIDQVMIIYAGEGEATTGSEDTIWPHEWDLISAGKSIQYVGDGVNDLYVNTYAAANEVEAYYGKYYLNGIGTICHEFSHCLGLPDMYDTYYGGNFGLGPWSLMDQGSYNGDGFCPAGYTSFERFAIGWMTPIDLTEATTVTNMQALITGGPAYRITNPKNSNEYYLLENRQLTSWDTNLPSAGLLVLHVDYEEELWTWNLVNTCNDDSSYGPLNDHQRCTIFHADGKEYSAMYSALMDEADAAGDDDAYYEYYNLYIADMLTDTYPQPDNNQLTNTSTPRAFTYNANTDGRKLMNISITEITQNADETVAFKFGLDDSGTEEGDNTDYGNTSDDPVPPTGDYLFYESFNNCDGKGGNDGKWSGTIANSSMNLDEDPDNPGWTAANGAYVANQCAKFGTSKKDGIAVTPAFTVNGTATLTFKAGAWDSNKDGTTLNLSVSAGSIKPASVTMTKGAWGTYTATITATGNVKVTFAAEQLRFFLDEVLAVDPNASAIQHIAVPSVTTVDSRIFTLDGRYVGTAKDQLPRGIYIIGGKKVVFK